MIIELKKYIDKHKMLKRFLWLAFSAGVLVLLTLAIKEKLQTGIKEFLVEIEYTESTKRLINAEYVQDEVRKELGFDVERSKIKDLDIRKLEEVLNNNQFIDSIELYINGRNELVAEVIQKNPIARIISKNETFYLDEKGDYLPLSPVAAVRVPVITGNLEQFDPGYKLEELHQYKDIFELITSIRKDEFADALIEQIHVESNGEFLLIPKLGKEKIILGDVTNLGDKIFNLKQFYKEGLTREGWGKFAYLDLRYEDQVVAQRK